MRPENCKVQWIVGEDRCVYYVTERKKQATPVKEVQEKKDEEEWPLKDVVFIEDIKTVPVGKVLKVSECGQGHLSHLG